MNPNKATEMLNSLDISFKYDSLYIKVDFVGIYNFHVNECLDFHSHSNYEFHYIYQGKGTVTINDKEFNLYKNCFYLTGPGELHKQIADKAFPMAEYALRCSIKHDTDNGNFTVLPGEDEFLSIISILDSKTGDVVKDSNNLEALFEKLFEEVYYKKPGFFVEIKNTILRILVASVRNYTNSWSSDYYIPTRDLDSYRFEIIRAYIMDNINRNITRQELARHVCLSIRQTDRIVKSQAGLSIHNLVINEKIRNAKKLLETSGLSLAEIAARIGFSSEYHLSFCFKKNVGFSPSEYRKGI